MSNSHSHTIKPSGMPSHSHSDGPLSGGATNPLSHWRGPTYRVYTDEHGNEDHSEGAQHRSSHAIAIYHCPECGRRYGR